MTTVTLRKLLVPMDFRAASLNALDLAVAMGQRHSAEIRLLHVINWGDDTYVWDDLVESSETLVKEKLLKLENLSTRYASEKGVVCTFECRLGGISRSIAEAAHDFNADCIVMGTRGTSGIREYFVGSEAYRVVKAASCPVLTVPHHRQWTQFTEIVFPIRPINGALEKYDFARPIIQKNKAHLTVVGLLDHTDPETVDQMTQQIARLNEQLLADGIDGNAQLLETDSIANTVLQKAGECNAELLVITADQDTASQHFFLGPFVQQIVNHSKVPVLAVRLQPDIPMQLQPTNGLFESITPSFPSALLPIQMG